jgi:RNA polymerase sigma factor (sigma-70 family)
VDLTQDIFIDLFSSLSGFVYQTRGQFYAYVFVITRRKLARHYDDCAKRREREGLELDEAKVAGTLGSEGSYATSYDIDIALRSLDEDTREIVVLRHWSRYSFSEIASLKDMTESAVRVRHHRALKTLADSLNINT